MRDDTEDIRRGLIPQMPEAAATAAKHGEQTWDTDQLRADFEVVGFLAPFVMVRRRADGVEGTLMFSHSPRVYFSWSES